MLMMIIWMLFFKLPIRSPPCSLSTLCNSHLQWRGHSLCWLDTSFKAHVPMSSICRQLPTASVSVCSCAPSYFSNNHNLPQRRESPHKFFNFWLIQPPVTFRLLSGSETALGRDNGRAKISCYEWLTVRHVHTFEKNCWKTIVIISQLMPHQDHFTPGETFTPRFDHILETICTQLTVLI